MNDDRDTTADPVPSRTPSSSVQRERAAAFDRECLHRGVLEAIQLLGPEPDQDVAEALSMMNPAIATRILAAMPGERRERLFAAAPAEHRDQWSRNLAYPEGSVGRLMEPAFAALPPDRTVGEAREVLRDVVRRAFITYAWVIDPAGRLLGVLVFRELLFARESELLEDVMLRDPFFLRPETSILEAMRRVLARHYPVYPVCDDTGRLVGVVRGQSLFEQEALEISAQPGRMVGVEREERISTPWWRSFRFRHPWLQFNLLTAFAAAAVVGLFQDTIERVVALAVFLPVLSGQSGNTGCQALAVTLRGLTLGEVTSGASALIAKEAWLGLLNGAAVGLVAALGMSIFAASSGHGEGLALALVVFLAMTGSCVASGIAGAIIPLALRRLGADPATASSIFLTTATDVASMGLFLGLGTWLVE